MNTEILLKNYITIANSTYGGTLEIFDKNENIKEFSYNASSGVLALNDLLIYEFSKYYKTLGTIGDLNLEIDTYEKLLRNYIDRYPYRRNGFFSVNAMEKYIKDFSKRRNIKIKTNVYRDFTSKRLFTDIIRVALENNHPLILQSGYNRLKSINQYVVVTGINCNKIHISNNGKLEEYKISDIFNFSDIQLSLFYIDIEIN